MTNTKQVYLNGQKYLITNNLTLQKFLDYFNYQNNIFVIEYNQIICNKVEWKNCIINQNDTIEVITIVGGGQTKKLKKYSFLITHKVNSHAKNNKKVI